jgi:putative endonuclease
LQGAIISIITDRLDPTLTCILILMTEQDEAYIYIMASHSGTLYIGSTKDIESRVYQNKSNDFEGFTKKYHCHRLVYVEILEDLASARQREYQIKKFRREKKERLISVQNPNWFDLSKQWGKSQ